MSRDMLSERELLAAIRLHAGLPGKERKVASVRDVVFSLVAAGYTHQEIETVMEDLRDRGEIYRPNEKNVGVVSL